MQLHFLNEEKLRASLCRILDLVVSYTSQTQAIFRVPCFEVSGNIMLYRLNLLKKNSFVSNYWANFCSNIEWISNLKFWRELLRGMNKIFRSRNKTANIFFKLDVANKRFTKKKVNLYSTMRIYCLFTCHLNIQSIRFNHNIDDHLP